MPRSETLPRPAFRRSTNISLISVAPAIQDYLVSPCALSAFERITARLYENDGQRAWTITGPYGTGKSSFAAFLAGLLGGRTNPSHSTLLTALERVSPKAATGFRAATRTNGRLVPVLVTGSREPIGNAVGRACIASLDQWCISGQAKRLKTQLTAELGEGRDLDLLNLVRRMHETVIRHESGVAGTIFILDELGKFLEFASRHPNRADVFSLQQAAELASTALGSLTVIGVLHQDFAAYGRDLAPEEKLEWEKIRGRFEDILFDEPADQLLRLLARSIRSEGPAGASEREWEQAFSALTRAKVLPSSIPRSEASSLLRQCWPLHPLTAISLGPVFKRYGQNERSAFTFAQSHEPFGLRDFMERGGSRMYLLADLFEYLTSTYGDGLVANRDGRHWAEALDIERRLTDADESERKVFRTTALLSIMGRWSERVPTPAFIEAALTPSLTAQATATAIGALRRRSLLVLRKFNDTLALWEGSDVDIEERLSVARASLPRVFTAADEVSKHIHLRPLIARRHSFESGTLRVFPIAFADAEGGVPKAPDGNKGDGQIVVLLSLTGRATDHGLPDQYTQPGDEHLVVVPPNSREVLALAQELACIEWVRRNTVELSGDATARRELDAREGEVRRRLAGEQTEMLFGETRGTPAKWYRQGKQVRVRDSPELNDLLSTVCDELFPAAPVIRNEIINRSEISSSAAAARRNLIQAMIERPTVEGLGIVGNPPERSVYLSVLRELGLHRPMSGGTYTFSADSEKSKNNSRRLLEGLHEFFVSAEGERRTVAELFGMLKAPPYGVRAGVLPVILAAVLIGTESEIALYEDGAFLPQLTVEVFERLMKTPELFAVRRWTVTGVRAAIFSQMSGLLGNPGESCTGREQVLTVVKPLLRFYRRLDAYSQNSRSLSDRAIQVRDALANATEPDQLLFTELPKACGVEPFASSSRGRDGDAGIYVLRLRESISELQRAYDALLQSLQHSLADAFGVARSLPTLRQHLSERSRAVEPVALDSETKTFIRRLGDNGIDDRLWLESLASLLAGKPTAAWNDDDRARFDVSLAGRARRFQSLEAMLCNASGNHRPGEHVVRLAVAGSGLRDQEVLIHLSKEQAAQTGDLADRVRAVFGAGSNLRHPNVVLATLARLIEETLGDSASPVAVGGKA